MILRFKGWPQFYLHIGKLNVVVDFLRRPTKAQVGTIDSETDNFTDISDTVIHMKLEMKTRFYNVIPVTQIKLILGK
jgi:cysteinyl-tRNA synthetase